ncbi:MAG: hypothetical protein ACI85Q_002215, partial [Salibacteraceae bacterium]
VVNYYPEELQSRQTSRFTLYLRGPIIVLSGAKYSYPIVEPTM